MGSPNGTEWSFGACEVVSNRRGGSPSRGPLCCDCAGREPAPGPQAEARHSALGVGTGSKRGQCWGLPAKGGGGPLGPPSSEKAAFGSH